MKPEEFLNIVKANVSYDKETGLFTRLSTGNIITIKDNQGYIAIKIHGKIYKGHRLAWLMLTENWPKDELAAGSHFAEPRVSADGTELRSPLEPALTVEICGQPLVSGRA